VTKPPSAQKVRFLPKKRLFSKEVGHGICSAFKGLLALELSGRLLKGNFRIGGDTNRIALRCQGPGVAPFGIEGEHKANGPGGAPRFGLKWHNPNGLTIKCVAGKAHLSGVYRPESSGIQAGG
jgi:hypothetical protein